MELATQESMTSERGSYLECFLPGTGYMDVQVTIGDYEG